MSNLPKWPTGPEELAVNDVVQAKRMCDHWGGEERSDPAERQTLADNQKIDCAKYRAALAKARESFPKNETLNALHNER